MKRLFWEIFTQVPGNFKLPGTFKLICSRWYFYGKSEGKERIQNALLGLVFLFISFLILKIINPALIDKGALTIAKVNIETTQQCGMKDSNHAKKAVTEYIEDLNAGGGYDWGLEASNYWILKDEKCIASLHGNPEASGCASQANAINTESINSQRGNQNEKIDVYARCIACSKDGGSNTCKNMTDDWTSDSKPIATSFSSDGDQIFLIFCRQFKTMDMGVAYAWKSRCVGDSVSAGRILTPVESCNSKANSVYPPQDSDSDDDDKKELNTKARRDAAMADCNKRASKLGDNYVVTKECEERFYLTKNRTCFLYSKK